MHECKCRSDMINFMAFLDGRCPPVPYVPHSTFSSTDATLGNMVTITCNKGYGINGTPASQTTRCTDGLEWDVKPQHCQCKN